MLARMWRKGKHKSLLFEIQTGIDIREKRMEAYPQTEKWNSIWPSISTPGYLTPKMRMLIWKYIRTMMFIASLFITDKYGNRDATWGYINKHMDKDPRCIYVCVCVMGDLLSHREEQSLMICNHMHGLGWYYAKWIKSKKEKYCMESIMCGM